MTEHQRTAKTRPGIMMMVNQWTATARMGRRRKCTAWNFFGQVSLKTRLILNSKKGVSDANVEHYWWSDILAWSSVATTACKLGTTNTFKKTCGLKIVFKEHCEIKCVLKLFMICMEKEEKQEKPQQKVNILFSINKPYHILLLNVIYFYFIKVSLRCNYRF